MANRITIKEFRLFLTHLGLKHIRTRSSHEIWDYVNKPLERPIVIDTNYPEILDLHIHRNLKTLKMSKKEFEEILRNLE